MPASTTFAVTNIGWVLPGGTGAGTALPEMPAWKPEDNSALEGFSAKSFLSSVKGYLDPAGAFCLAASALALQESNDGGEGIRERSGISTLTRYGAPQSGYKFFEMFLKKGARFASPMVFPHGYANTAGNLAAIEFAFGGPHLVLQGNQDVREAVEFAASQLAQNKADEMLVTAYEAVNEKVLPDGKSAMNGALAIRLIRAEGDTGFSLEAMRQLPMPDLSLGAVSAFLSLLRQLGL